MRLRRLKFVVTKQLLDRPWVRAYDRALARALPVEEITDARHQLNRRGVVNVQGRPVLRNPARGCASGATSTSIGTCRAADVSHPDPGSVRSGDLQCRDWAWHVRSAQWPNEDLPAV